jgi:hypothetical protein
VATLVLPPPDLAAYRAGANKTCALIPLGFSGINSATNAPWPSIDDALAAHEAQTERLRVISQWVIAGTSRVFSPICWKAKQPDPAFARQA